MVHINCINIYVVLNLLQWSPINHKINRFRMRRIGVDFGRYLILRKKCAYFEVKFACLIKTDRSHILTTRIVKEWVQYLNIVRFSS